MKLNEILDFKLASRKTRVPFDVKQMEKQRDAKFKKELNRKQGPLAAVGGFAYGRKKKHDPFMFKKMFHVPINMARDGYIMYVAGATQIMDHNPYVPRIYRMDITTDPKGRQKPNMEMESLVHLDAVEPEIVYGIFERLFPKIAMEWKKDIFRNDMETSSSMDIGKNICWILKNMIANDAYRNKCTDDESLKEVTQMIAGILKKNPRCQQDLDNVYNIMLRLGPTPQLVITDPIKGGS